MRYQDVKAYYESVYRHDPDEAFPFDAERYTSWLSRIPHGLGPGARALDIGCGVGFACEILAKRGFEVHGIDISEAALERARRRVPEASFRTSSETGQLDYDDEYFDLVLCLGVLEHIATPDVVVAETRRVLRRGGTAIFMVPNSLSPYFWLAGGTGQALEVPRRLREWKAMFERAGLRVTSVGRDPGPSWRPTHPLKKKLKLAAHRVLNRLPLELTYQFVFTLA